MYPGARRLWKPDASRYRGADDPGPQGREITHDKPYGFCYTDIRMPGQKGFAPGGISMEPEGGTKAGWERRTAFRIGPSAVRGIRQ